MWKEELERFQQRRLPAGIVRILRARFTPTGRAFLLLWGVAFYLGVNPTYAPILPVWSVATVALAASALLSRLALPRLRLLRLPIQAACAGEEITVEIEIENPTRRTARDVRVREEFLPGPIRAAAGEPPLAREIAPRGRSVVNLRLRCPKRGAYTLRGLRAGSSFPLGLMRSEQRSRQASTFLVYPSFTTPSYFTVPEGRQYQPGGFLLSSNVGESAEFMHTREYRHGDNPRHIHWASWGRLAQPVVKVFHEEYFVRLALVLDTEVPRGAGDAAFESGISVAAGIADYLSRRDYIIDIFAAGPRVYRFQAGRAIAHFQNVLEILACLEAAESVDWRMLEEAILPDAPRLTAVLAVFMDWDRTRADLVGLLASVGVATRVIVVRDGPTTLKPSADSAEAFVHLAPGQLLEEGGPR